MLSKLCDCGCTLLSSRNLLDSAPLQIARFCNIDSHAPWAVSITDFLLNSHQIRVLYFSMIVKYFAA
jgi:hypothetical protein